MVRERGLRYADLNVPTRDLRDITQDPDDLKPHRVAERVQHTREVQLPGLRMRDYTHWTIVRLTSNDGSSLIYQN